MSEREYPVPSPRDDIDAVKDLARDLADGAAQLSTFKGEANAYLSDPTYNALRHRLEIAHAGWWRRQRCRRGGGCGSTRAARRIAPEGFGGPGSNLLGPSSCPLFTEVPRNCLKSPDELPNRAPRDYS